MMTEKESLADKVKREAAEKTAQEQLDKDKAALSVEAEKNGMGEPNTDPEAETALAEKLKAAQEAKDAESLAEKLKAHAQNTAQNQGIPEQAKQERSKQETSRHTAQARLHPQTVKQYEQGLGLGASATPEQKQRRKAEKAQEKLMKMGASAKNTPDSHILFGFAGTSFTLGDLRALTGNVQRDG